MSHLVVNGGKKLHGSIVTQTNKNSALSILCAALMIDGKTTITDVPAIEEVTKILTLIASTGAVVERKSDRSVIIDTSKGLHFEALDKKTAETTRASLLFFGALAARGGQYKLSKSGGCNLGTRTVKPHIFTLEKFGITITSHEGYYMVKNPKKLVAARVIMYESGDTTTENAIMTAVLAKGTSVIKMASSNYMVQDLCYFLVAAGAKIQGIGSTTLIIEGVEKLGAVTAYPIMPDPIASMTLIAGAIVTKSHVTVTNCPLEFLELELEKLKVMGQNFVIHNERKSKNGHFDIVDIELKPSALTALPDKVYGRPFPGLNIDNLPLFIPILTQAEGRTLVHDWAYDNRATYGVDLQKIGAKVTLLDPHRLWVEGPVSFVPADMTCPPALRPAVNVLLCLMAAPGESILRNYFEIDRGYENLYEVLNAAGADIKVIND